MKNILFCISVSTCLTTATIASASDFSLPFTNAAGLGNSYAGWAVDNTDASTAYTNPAAMTSLEHQQITLAGVFLTSQSVFTGTASSSFTAPQSGTATSKPLIFMPALYYVAPLNDKISLGLHLNGPWGLSTNYGKDSIVRYADIKSQILGLDLGPSLAYQLTDKISLGIGLNIEYLDLTLNNMYAVPFMPDIEAQNHTNGWGVGWNTGILIQPTSKTRVGLSYNSRVHFKTTGKSSVGNEQINNQQINITLPDRVQLSIAQEIGQRLTLLGTMFYTAWSLIDKITLQNTVTPIGISPITIPFNYKDTLDFSVGFNFKASARWLLRSGVQFIQTPSNDIDRTVVDPLGSGVLWGMGIRFQQNKRISYDLSYAHGFLDTTTINSITPLTSTVGNVKTHSDIFGFQINVSFG